MMGKTQKYLPFEKIFHDCSITTRENEKRILSAR